MIFKEIHKGIDSLYLSYRGEAKPEIIEELEKKKMLAQSESAASKMRAVMLLENHCFEVRDKGRGFYKYVLVDNWYQIQIAGSIDNKVPDIYTQISSELLNCSGIEKAESELENIIPHFLIETNEGSISRIDIFVDFVTDMDFSNIAKKEWVTRAHKVDMHWDKNIFTGWSIGVGADISARLYNKTVEIKKSKKDFFKEIWKRNDWEEETVWRLEFQLKKKVLSQMSVYTVEDFKQSVNDVWSYCTQLWLRLGIDNGTENRSRWEVNPFWINIQGVSFGDGSFTGIGRSVDKARTPDDRLLFQNGIGYIISYAAKYDIKSMDVAVYQFYNETLRHLNQEARIFKKFKNCHDYIETKLKLKKRQYNKIIEK